MATTPKQALHEWIDRLDDEEARRMADALSARGTRPKAPTSRPLTESDLVLSTPVLPDEETADDMIATVRRWRQDGGYA
ncbi:MAG: hypothetical protein HY329_05240 [Chloroflexi bacterium]|nr:hypothetical protein [Chloroflexota bacterium]